MADANVSAGQAALAAGEWHAARDAFTAALHDSASAEALDGLAQALWWLKSPDDALRVRAKAFAAYRRARRPREAALAAVWLAREHRSLHRNAAVAQGWLARAARIAATAEVGSAQGWIALARAEIARDVSEALRHVAQAAEVAVAHGDVDLEIVALARSGVLHIAAGRVEDGVRELDEAMAAATAGEGARPENVGEAFCALMEASSMVGDTSRFTQWAQAVADFREVFDYGPLGAYGGPTTASVLSSYCGACCGGVLMVTGRLDDAEQELTAAIAELTREGLHSRCVHPVTQLAELRVAQGRFEEAAALLSRYADAVECARPQATLALATGEPGVAVAHVQRGLAALKDQTVRAFSLIALSVDACLAVGDVPGAAAAAGQLSAVADLTDSAAHRAEALFARGKLAAARDDPEADELLRAAARACSDAAMVLTACRARFAVARNIAGTDRGIAVAEARAALTAFEQLGATLDADAAASFLRELGVRGRTGPKNVGVLSAREQEVLRLLAEGLSNAEIAGRLFISTKTAGHHVSSILSKLGLRSRTEAAAYAVLNLPRPVSQ